MLHIVIARTMCHIICGATQCVLRIQCQYNALLSIQTRWPWHCVAAARVTTMPLTTCGTKFKRKPEKWVWINLNKFFGDICKKLLPNWPCSLADWAEHRRWIFLIICIHLKLDLFPLNSNERRSLGDHRIALKALHKFRGVLRTAGRQFWRSGGSLADPLSTEKILERLATRRSWLKNKRHLN